MKLIGRRVKIIRAQDSIGALGKIGTIVEARDGDGLVCVRIKGWDQGHGGKDGLDSSERWYFTRRCVRLLPRKARKKKKS